MGVVWRGELTAAFGDDGSATALHLEDLILKGSVSIWLKKIKKVFVSKIRGKHLRKHVTPVLPLFCLDSKEAHDFLFGVREYWRL